MSSVCHEKPTTKRLTPGLALSKPALQALAPGTVCCEKPVILHLAPEPTPVLLQDDLVR